MVQSRRIALATALAVLLASSAAVAKVTLTWSTWLGGDQLNVLSARIAEFERQNPDIDVEILSFAGSDYKAKLLSMFATGTAPDVAHTVVYDAPHFIREGMLLDVSRFAREIPRSEYYISDVYVREGRVYGGFESHVQVYPIYYNPDLFAAAGLLTPNEYAQRGQWTWETFREAARKLTQRGSDGRIVRYGIQIHPLWEVGWGVFGLSNGAEIVNRARTRVTVDDPAMVEALDFLVDLYQADHVAPRPGEPLPSGDPLLNGTAAMVLQGSWQMNYYKQFGSGVAWDIAPSPRGRSDTVYRAPGADGVVLASTQHPEEAWRLVRFFLDEFVQFDKAKSKLEVPVMKRALASDVYLAAPPASMRVIGDLLAHSIPQPVFAGAVEVRGVLEQQLLPAFRGERSLETAVAEAARLGQAKLMEFQDSR
ncbi:MAG TPA: sugar ABC transporter substrate-binding protein [Limnochordia bacterium]